MAKTTAPLLSFDARGQIGKTQVYSRWRGVGYSRRWTQPANPRTSAQMQTRDTMKWLTQVWKLLNAAAQAPWIAFAKGQPLTGVNAFIKSNLSTLRGPTGAPPADLTGYIGSPGAGGGPAPAALVLSDGGSHTIDATMTAPALPTGWTIVAAHATAIKQQSAPSGTIYQSFYATDVSAPYAPAIATGAAGTYETAGWFEFMKPDGSTAYGPSLSGSVVIA